VSDNELKIKYMTPLRRGKSFEFITRALDMFDPKLHEKIKIEIVSMKEIEALEQENAKLKERLKDAESILSELNSDFDSMEHSYVGRDSDYHKRIKAVLKWGSDE
jgi:predicted nuclease with TOPRIM domain